MTVAEIKHKHFAKNFVEQKGHITKAYQKTYPDSKNKAISQSNGSKLLKKPEVKKNIAEVLEDQGVDDKYLSRSLKRMLNAKKEVVSNGQIVKLVDNPTSLATVRTVLELRGDLNRVETQSITQVNLNLSNSPQDFSGIADKLTEINNKLINSVGYSDGQVHAKVNPNVEDAQVVDAE